MGAYNLSALANMGGEIARAPLQQMGVVQQQQEQRQQFAKDQQLRSQTIKQNQIQLNDQKAGSLAMQEWDGKDMNQLPTLLVKHGASVNAVMGLKKNLLDYATQQSTKAKTDLENEKQVHDEVAGTLSAGLDPKQVSDADLPSWIRTTGQTLQQGGKIDPQHEAMIEQLAQMPPAQARQQLDIQRKGFMAQSQINDELAKKAEANMNNAKASLDAVQSEAANYKEDPNLGLIDLRTKQPVNASAIAPLSAQEAAVLGKNEGDKVPVKLKNTANEIMNRGIRTVQANGRSLLVDGQGNTIKDLGVAPAVTTFNLNNAGAAVDGGGNPSAIAQAIANGSMKWSEAVSPRTPMATKNAIMSQVYKLNPNYDTAEFGLEADAAKKARSGAWADTRVAYNTAIDHADQLLKAADALNNKDSRTLNSLKNFFKTEFGSPDVPTFDAIANAYNHEVTSVVSKGHITDAEIAAGHAVMPSNAGPDQIKGTAQAFKNLMSSKRDELDKVIRAAAGNKANSVLGVRSSGEGASAKVLPMSAIQQAARDHGVSVDEAKRQAQAAGYTIQ